MKSFAQPRLLSSYMTETPAPEIEVSVPVLGLPDMPDTGPGLTLDTRSPGSVGGGSQGSLGLLQVEAGAAGMLQVSVQGK